MARKLVTVRKIDAIDPIEGADRIKVATVDGWKVVVKADEFNVGDYAVYFEIDSFLPIDDERYEFLVKSSRKKMGEKVGLRLRTIKLRGQVSQGLLLPVKLFPEVLEYAEQHNGLENVSNERHDLSDVLDVVKYEPPETGTGGRPAGSFPSYIPKTDEERVQNIHKELVSKYSDVVFTPTLKLDGSSTTVAYVNCEQYFVNPETDDLEDQIIVCSRNQALKYDADCIWVKGLENDNIPENLKKWGRENNRQIAIQGELVGPGVQKNREKFDQYKVFAFRIWDIDKQEFVDGKEFDEITKAIGMDTTIQYDPFKVLSDLTTVDDILEYADGDSINHNNREGIVFTANVDGERVSFKAISNRFLLNGGS